MNYSMGRSYKQETPASEWTITHNFGRPVAVTTCVNMPDGKLHQVLPLDVIIVDNNTVKIVFPYAVTGEARIA
ncbi:hypothetical protein MPK67_gp095 [Erwinia phage pEa_SNUABM_32]|uniref:Uncharacterized protein n=2 Tax=Alexandravirus TaxID=2733088 RepID=A0AAE8BYU8_9CAUD|nr:hypothetical protein MPK67_gp095 [Erwinia phage pEa_SNUABM_32]YP_010301208.1 hypothetical protein MPK68_gp095 [Erwinia phage pEa_SNUABM_3]QZE56631.1 hypothetical protein pEaSNUABM20_00095 [Erwinia phage pEa_SNUABM_20]QZE58311.1 hypothetical protein pEaSNUABM40_00095 [Erwinia phage pEa_SNUABM_40]UAW52876.1 hypothetical protein pEaSNUABM23_00094 [Erwinia phage pEa_SNUABM_23]UIW10772.1 hypothetical protein pEaSNUABM23_00094 [Erwinia phage pEa_SNUABM_31]QZE56292.1 hypothetical protein pEaSNUAB